MVFERFTEDGREVVVRAQEHARQLRHDWVGCEHILLGVAGSRSPVAALFRDRGAQPQALEDVIAAWIGPGRGDNDDKVALAALGIDLDQVRHAVEATFGSGAFEVASARRRRGLRRRLRPRRTPCRTMTGGLPFTPRAKRCLELSLRESLRLKHGSIGVEHIALALLAKDDTAAWKVLLRLGVDPPELRRAIVAWHRRTA